MNWLEVVKISSGGERSELCMLNELLICCVRDLDIFFWTGSHQPVRPHTHQFALCFSIGLNEWGRTVVDISDNRPDQKE